MGQLLKELFEKYAKRLLTNKVRPSISEEGIMTIPNKQRVEKMAQNLYEDFKKAGVPDNILKTENDIKVFHHKIAEINNENMVKQFDTLMSESTLFNPKKSADVFDLKGNKIKNPDNIMGGEEIIETEADILTRLNKGNKESLSNIRYENAVKAEEAKAAADEDYIMKVLDPEDFSKGGRAGYYGGGQAMVEPDLSDIGHGSDALMGRTRLTAPGSQATTSTGLNYLLGEDNDTVRVPYNNGNMVLPKPKPAQSPLIELSRIYKTYEEAMPGVSKDTQKYLQQDFIQKLQDAKISQEEFMTYRMQNNFADGGRIGFKGGGADMGAPEKAAERTSRGYGTAPDTGSRRGTNDYSTTTQTQNHDRAMRDNQQPPESNYEKTIGTIQKANDFNKVYQVAKAGSLKPLLAINPYAIGITGLIALDKRRKRKQAYEDSLLEEETLMPFAEGGRIGYNKGKAVKEVADKGRRGFMKAAGVAGAGIAALKTGLLGFADKAAPVVEKVAETVSETAQGVPPYFLNLVSKIKNLGESTLAAKDKANAYKFKDYVMEEDFAGNIEIIKKGDDVAEDVFMSYKVDEVPLKGKKGSSKVEEYEEYTARPDAEGKMKDIEQGVPDEVVQEGTVFEDTLSEFGKADGGRIGYGKGDIVTKGGPALIKAGEGMFTKAQYLIERIKNTIKGSPDDKYVQETFPNFIKELEANPDLAKNENVFKELGGDLPEGQQIVVYGDDTLDFFTTSNGPQNIKKIDMFMEKHGLSREKALEIMKMEPNDQVMELTKTKFIKNKQTDN